MRFRVTTLGFYGWFLMCLEGSGIVWTILEGSDGTHLEGSKAPAQLLRVQSNTWRYSRGDVVGE
jgi:hypothetical protein